MASGLGLSRLLETPALLAVASSLEYIRILNLASWGTQGSREGDV